MSRLGFIAPQLPSLIDHPPQGSDWIHEVKHDGYRCQVLLERGQARVFTRNGYDWSDRYPSIVRAAANLRCKSAIIDGEAIVQDGNGVSDFEALSSAMQWRPHSIILYAFDLMHLDGKDLRQQALSERRSILKALLGSDDESRIQFSEEFVGDADAFFRACADKRLEGMVSKLANSRYKSGRSKTWLKTKCFTETSLLIIGTDRDRKTGALRALLAKADKHTLSYAGAAFIGLRGDAWHELRERLQQIAIKGSPVIGLRLKDAQWVEPTLTARVRHLAGAKYLRHAVVKTLE
jgi:bifunctional non-homologous end joining protein LigD